jgi:hypothetical protein
MLRPIHAVLLFTMATLVSGFAADKPKADLFKNFEYPFAESEEWPNHLEWLNTDGPEKIRLVNGNWREPQSDSELPFNGLTLKSVEFGDVTGDGRPEAIVVLRYDTGGTQYSHYVYVYSVKKKPLLLALFHSGDRAASGLYRTYPQSGKLVVELYAPEKQQVDCCSAGFVRMRFRWTNLGFQPVGQPEHGTPRVSTRLPVDTFGNHH